MQKPAQTIFTFGHSNKPLWLFRLKLLQNEIDLVVDVRTIPQSRYCPHFNKNALQCGLWERHIKYQWRGKNLGGRELNTNYEKTVDEITALVKKGVRVCLVCSEANPYECHRHIMLEPSFKERGLEVVHILYDLPEGKKSKAKQPKLFQ
jgi:uncharacterized protein (DUF488 family)